MADNHDDSGAGATLEPSALAILEHASKALVLASFCVLAISVAYDFGFLLALGLWFSSIPTTVADHARTAIIWIPGALLVILLMVVFEKVLNFVSRFPQWLARSLRLPLSREKRGGDIQRNDQSGLAWLDVVLITAGLLFGAGGTWSIALALPFYFWARLSHGLLNRRSEPKLPNVALVFVVLVAGASFLTAFIGYYVADQMVSLSKPDISILLRGEAGQSKMTAKMIRRFSEVSIVITGEDDVWVISNERIVSTHNKTFVKFGQALRGGGGGPGWPPP